MDNRVPSSYAQDNQGEIAELDLTEVYFILRRNLKRISFITIFFILGSTLMTLIATPVYDSFATISVDEDNTDTMSLFDMGLDDPYNQINDEMAILKSRTLAEDVVRYLWTSEHRDSLLLFGTREMAPNLVTSFAKEIISMAQDTEEVTERDPLPEAIPDSIFSSAVSKIQKGLKLTNESNTNVISITLSSNDPDEAALLVNTMIYVYQTRDQAWASGEITNLREFLDEQIKVIEKDLQETEDSLLQFQQAEKIFDLETDSKLLLEQLSRMEGDYYHTEAEFSILAERRKYVVEQLSAEEKQLYDKLSNSISANLTMLQAEIAQAETELVMNIIQYGEEHSAVNSTRERLGRLRETMAIQTQELIKQEISATDPIRYRQTLMDTILAFDAQAYTLTTVLKEQKKLADLYADQLNELPEKLLMYTRLDRIRNIQAETYSFLRQKLEESNISAASELGKVRIIDTAIPSKEPISPKTTVNVTLGFLFGILFALVYTFFREFLDNTVKSIDEIERRNLTILAIIPSIGREYKKKEQREKKKRGIPAKMRMVTGNNGAKKIKRRLITQEMTNSALSESYRVLRTTLMYADTQSDKGAIIVTSSGPGEGKTTTISNLAITYANLGKRTLLVDTDLRKSIVHKLFNVQREDGITHYLTGQVDDHKKLIKATEVDNLSIMTSGLTPPNPSELLGSDKMSKLIKQLVDEWDVVLFDTPPILAVTDSTMIAQQVHHVVLVVRPGVTDRAGFRRSVSTLRHMNIGVTGVVFNGISEKNTYGYYNYSNYYYHYYSDSTS